MDTPAKHYKTRTSPTQLNIHMRDTRLQSTVQTKAEQISQVQVAHVPCHATYQEV